MVQVLGVWGLGSYALGFRCLGFFGFKFCFSSV